MTYLLAQSLVRLWFYGIAAAGVKVFYGMLEGEPVTLPPLSVISVVVDRPALAAPQPPISNGRRFLFAQKKRHQLDKSEKHQKAAGQMPGGLNDEGLAHAGCIGISRQKL